MEIIGKHTDGMTMFTKPVVRFLPGKTISFKLPNGEQTEALIKDVILSDDPTEITFTLEIDDKYSYLFTDGKESWSIKEVVNGTL